MEVERINQILQELGTIQVYDQQPKYPTLPKLLKLIGELTGLLLSIA